MECNARREEMSPITAPTSAVYRAIVEATILEEKDAGPSRTQIDLTMDDYDALRRACSDVSTSRRLIGSVWVMRSGPQDRLTAQQQALVSDLLFVSVSPKAALQPVTKRIC
jgi:hypothetical protein